MRRIARLKEPRGNKSPIDWGDVIVVDIKYSTPYETLSTSNTKYRRKKEERPILARIEPTRKYQLPTGGDDGWDNPDGVIWVPYEWLEYYENGEESDVQKH